MVWSWSEMESEARMSENNKVGETSNSLCCLFDAQNSCTGQVSGLFISFKFLLSLSLSKLPLSKTKVSLTSDRVVHSSLLFSLLCSSLPFLWKTDQYFRWQCEISVWTQFEDRDRFGCHDRDHWGTESKSHESAGTLEWGRRKENRFPSSRGRTKSVLGKC